MSTATLPATKVVEYKENDLERAIDETYRRSGFDSIQMLVSDYQKIDLEDHFKRSIGLSLAMTKLLAIIDAAKEHIMPLQGSRLGFKTDKAYTWDVVRFCVAEALINGARLVGNEFNIIGGNCYSTKEFFERAVPELDGVSDIDIMLGVPEMNGPNALVECVITYKYNGKPEKFELRNFEEIDLRIPIRVNSGMIVDAILGKATRKAMAKLYKKLTGRVFLDADMDDVIDGAKTMQLTPAKSNGKSNGKPGLATASQKQAIATLAKGKGYASGSEAVDACGYSVNELTFEDAATLIKGLKSFVTKKQADEIQKLAGDNDISAIVLDCTKQRTGNINSVFESEYDGLVNILKAE